MAVNEGKKVLTVNLSLWTEDFTDSVAKLIEFQKTALSTNAFYFDRGVWLNGFESAVSPSAPIEPSNMFMLVFYSLEYLASNELSESIRDAKPEDMLAELAAILSLVFAKNQDYGSSALQVPLLLPWLDPRCALLVRLSDKIQRLRTLFNAEKSAVDESILDTLRDVVGYVFLLYAVLRTEENTSQEEDATDESGTV